MGAEQTFSVQEVLDVIEHMPLEDQVTVIQVLQRRLLEQQRSEIARNATTTLQAVREGNARYGQWKTSSGTWIHEKTVVGQ